MAIYLCRFLCDVFLKLYIENRREEKKKKNPTENKIEKATERNKLYIIKYSETEYGILYSFSELRELSFPVLIRFS